MRLICLTFAHNKLPFWLHASLVIVVERNLQNPLETAVTTNLMSQKGPIIYSVMESPGDVAAMVNRTLAGEVDKLIY